MNQTTKKIIKHFPVLEKRGSDTRFLTIPSGFTILAFQVFGKTPTVVAEVEEGKPVIEIEAEILTEGYTIKKGFKYAGSAFISEHEFYFHLYLNREGKY